MRKSSLRSSWTTALAAACLAMAAPCAMAQTVKRLEAGTCPSPVEHPQVWFDADPIYASSPQKRDLLTLDGTSIPGAIKDNGIYATTAEVKFAVADAQVAGRIKVNGATNDPQTKQPYITLPAGSLILDTREYANPVDLRAGLIQCGGHLTRALVISNSFVYSETSATSRWPGREKRIESVARTLFGDNATALEFVSRSYLSPAQNAAWDAFFHPAAAAASAASSASSQP